MSAQIKLIILLICLIVVSGAAKASDAPQPISSYYAAIDKSISAFMSSSSLQGNRSKPISYSFPNPGLYLNSKSCSQGICSFSFNSDLKIKEDSRISNESLVQAQPTSVKYCSRISLSPSDDVLEVKKDLLRKGFSLYSDTMCATSLSGTNKDMIFVGKVYSATDFLFPYIPFESGSLIRISSSTNSTISEKASKYYPNIYTSSTASVVLHNDDDSPVTISGLNILEGSNSFGAIELFEDSVATSTSFKAYSSTLVVPAHSSAIIYVEYANDVTNLVRGALELIVTKSDNSIHYSYLSLVGGSPDTLATKVKLYSKNSIAPVVSSVLNGHRLVPVKSARAGSSIEVPISIKNTGVKNLSVSSVSTTDPNIIINSTSTCDEVLPQGTCSMSLIISQDTVGVYRASDFIEVTINGEFFKIPFVAMFSAVDFEAIGEFHSIFRDLYNNGYASGYSGPEFSSFGNGMSNTTVTVPTPINIAFEGFVGAVAGDLYSIFSSQGELFSSGDNSDGGMGVNGQGSSVWITSQVHLGSLGFRNSDTAKGSQARSAIVTNEGALIMAGDCGLSGVISDNCSIIQQAFVQVSTPSPVLKVSLGSDFVCILTTLEQVFCKGANNFNQISATGSTVSTWQLVANNVRDFATTSNSLAVVTQEGKVYCRGSNSNGECGRDDSGSNLFDYLVEVPVLSPILSVSADSSSFWMFDIYNRLEVTGPNIKGKLGDGSGASSLKNTSISVVNNVGGFKVGNNSLSILNINGALLASGNNGHGQLGIGTSADSNVLQPVLF